MQPTIATIQESLGDLIYGENEIELHHVVAELLQAQNKSVAILDAGLDGALAKLIAVDEGSNTVVTDSQIVNNQIEDLSIAAVDYALSTGTHYGLVIGPINRDPAAVESGESFYEVVISDGDHFHQKSIRFSGHSEWREDRAAKEVLNFFRLHLLSIR